MNFGSSIVMNDCRATVERDVDNEGDYACVEVAVYKEISLFPLNFAMSLNCSKKYCLS
jgi:hypothetical protein